jgi:hypothetical protein
VQDVGPAASLVFGVHVELERVVFVKLLSAEFFVSFDREPLTAKNVVCKKLWCGVPGVCVVHVADVSIRRCVPRVGHPEVGNTSSSTGVSSDDVVPAPCSRKSHGHVVSSNGDLNPGVSVDRKSYRVNTEVAAGICAGSDVESGASREEPSSGDSILGATAIPTRESHMEDTSPAVLVGPGFNLELKGVVAMNAFFPDKFALAQGLPVTTTDAIAEQAGFRTMISALHGHVSNVGVCGPVPRIGHIEMSTADCSVVRTSGSSEPSCGSTESDTHVVPVDGDHYSGHFLHSNGWCVNTEVSALVGSRANV